jgi:hypothetical protein
MNDAVEPLAGREQLMQAQDVALHDRDAGIVFQVRDRIPGPEGEVVQETYLRGTVGKQFLAGGRTDEARAPGNHEAAALDPRGGLGAAFHGAHRATPSGSSCSPKYMLFTCA